MATSTLAAGVNLPAHRVVIREPTMGGRPLTVTAFRQVLATSVTYCIHAYIHTHARKKAYA